MRTLFTLLFLFASVSFAEPAAPKGRVFFKAPKDGATVTSPVKVEMRTFGIKVRKAGEDPKDQTTGHHHLIVDGGPVPAGTVIPTDATHLHYGKGQESAEIPLSPGPHTLTLQFADGAHRSYGPALSKTIHITVK